MSMNQESILKVIAISFIVLIGCKATTTPNSKKKEKAEYTIPDSIDDDNFTKGDVGTLSKLGNKTNKIDLHDLPINHQEKLKFRNPQGWVNWKQHGLTESITTISCSPNKQYWLGRHGLDTFFLFDSATKSTRKYTISPLGLEGSTSLKPDNNGRLLEISNEFNKSCLYEFSSSNFFYSPIYCKRDKELYSTFTDDRFTWLLFRDSSSYSLFQLSSLNEVVDSIFFHNVIRLNVQEIDSNVYKVSYDSFETRKTKFINDQLNTIYECHSKRNEENFQEAFCFISNRDTIIVTCDLYKNEIQFYNIFKKTSKKYSTSEYSDHKLRMGSFCNSIHRHNDMIIGLYGISENRDSGYSTTIKFNIDDFYLIKTTSDITVDDYYNNILNLPINQYFKLLMSEK